jgi:hypothetical protein
MEINYHAPQQKSDMPLPVGQPTVIVINNGEHLRSYSVMANCPSCSKIAPTNATSKCSCGNYMCYCWFGFSYWLLFNAYRRKDINCCDAIHNCSQCGMLLGNYTAC